MTLEALFKHTEDDKRTALEPFAAFRHNFDTVKLCFLIDLMEHVHGRNDELRKGLQALNEHLNTVIRPVYGRMMTERRKP